MPELPELSKLTEAQKDELIKQLYQLIGTLEARIKELEGQVSKDSHNSSKPPSSDGAKKAPASNQKSQREKGKRKVGGQAGHAKHGLERRATPDKVEQHKPHSCPHCHHHFSNEDIVGWESRQVIDLPELKTEVTEHQSAQMECPHCQQLSQGAFPEGVDQDVQYGNNIKALGVYLKNYQFIPYERVTELLKDLFKVSPSVGSLVNFAERCHNQLQGFEEVIKVGLLKSPLVCFDESGLRVEGKGHWIHTASTSELTYYFVHKKRGCEAMNAAEILPNYTGIAVHDGYVSYPTYKSCHHALCNAHHLRELTLMYEHYGQEWAGLMMMFLKELWKRVKRERDLGHERFSRVIERLIGGLYDTILEDALDELALLPNPPPNAKGKPKQHPAKNLHSRLVKKKAEVLRFSSDFRVPFDNNQAERDIRMIKTQQKVSGTFRTLSGARVFCRIRSYISTLKKGRHNVLSGIVMAITNGGLAWPGLIGMGD